MRATLAVFFSIPLSVLAAFIIGILLMPVLFGDRVTGFLVPSFEGNRLAAL